MNIYCQAFASASNNDYYRQQLKDGGCWGYIQSLQKKKELKTYQASDE